MHHIRPYQVFGLIEAPPSQRAISIALPSRRGLGGPSLLETALIVAASRIVAAKRLFEFGTFLGGTTLNLALNAPDNAEIFTLDLDHQHVTTGFEQAPEDFVLTQLHLASRSNLDFAGSPVEEKIQCLTANSKTFDFSPWKRSIDFSFIDGGHDLLTAKSDTGNALEMAATETHSCIVWHDYRNWDCPALTGYLNELSERLSIFHIEDTMLCVWFNDPADAIVSRLMN